MPTLDLERELLRDARFVAGVDEVGRGALAGPVAIGVAVVSAQTSEPPAGLDDSKRLTLRKRESLIDPIAEWAVAHAVGMASAAEIDEVGIIAAMRLAWTRAVANLAVVPDRVILDGSHDWLTPPPSDLFAQHSSPVVPVTMRVKADLECASVSAASVVAKVARDALMRTIAVEHPEYGWDGNVGYGSAGHMAALRELGATSYHRRSWNLPIG